MVKSGKFAKWKIDVPELENYVISEDGELWRKPHFVGLKKYNWRKIKLQSKNRWRIGNRWWSKNQLRPNLSLLEELIEIEKVEDAPF